MLTDETWNFQFWYRDKPFGAAGYNFSDGLTVTFCDYALIPVVEPPRPVE